MAAGKIRLQEFKDTPQGKIVFIGENGQLETGSYDVSEYITETDVSNISGNLQSQIDTKQDEITLVEGNNISIIENPPNIWTISADITGSNDLDTLDTRFVNITGDTMTGNLSITTEGTSEITIQPSAFDSFGQSISRINLGDSAYMSLLKINPAIISAASQFTIDSGSNNATLMATSSNIIMQYLDQLQQFNYANSSIIVNNQQEVTIQDVASDGEILITDGDGKLIASGVVINDISTSANKLLISNSSGEIDVATNTSVTDSGAVRLSSTQLASEGSITIDLALGNNFNIPALTGDITLANPTSQIEGQSGRIYIIQGSTPRTILFGTHWKFPGGNIPTLTATADAKDMIVYEVLDSGFIATQMINDLR